MPRHDFGGREAVAAVPSGSFRASMVPGNVLAGALSFHQSRGDAPSGLAHRTRRTSSNKKRDSFTAVTDESATESSWHSVDGSVGGGAGGSDGTLHLPELLLTGSQLEKRVGLQILHKKVAYSRYTVGIAVLRAGADAQVYD